MALETFPEGGENRGKHGPVRVQVNPGLNASSRMFEESCRAFGIPPMPDPNAPDAMGVGRMQTNVGGGVRQSSSRAYLAPAMQRPNLEVIADANVDGLIIENGAATGVSLVRGGQALQLSAEREVILCAGAVGSPLLLEASGIGDGERLRRLGIDVRAHLPAVGENARDHYFASLKLRLRGVQTLNGSDGGIRAAVNGLRYLLTRGGPLSETPTELIGFSRLPGETSGPPALEFWCNPLTYAYKEVRGKMKAVMDSEPGMSVSFYPCYPRSVGQVHLGENGRPSIVANYLTDPHDQYVTVEGLRMLRRIVGLAPLAEHVIGERAPSAGLGDGADELLDYARATGNTGFHLCGTCRMGADEGSVVDQELRVRGVRRLRIADASVMPTIISTHTNAPSMMIAERAASFIRQGR
jgi:choline dehydrogenase